MTQLRLALPLSDSDSDSDYDSDYDSESSPCSITWTDRQSAREIREHLEDRLIDDNEIRESENGCIVLGTWSLIDGNHYVSVKLNIAAYLKCGPLYTEYFGYIQWNDRPNNYDIMKVYCIMNDGFMEYRAVIKTYWLRLVQRHWKTRVATKCVKIKGLLSAYEKNKPNIYNHNHETPSTPK